MLDVFSGESFCILLCVCVCYLHGGGCGAGGRGGVVCDGNIGGGQELLFAENKKQTTMSVANNHILFYIIRQICSGSTHRGDVNYSKHKLCVNFPTLVYATLITT